MADSDFKESLGRLDELTPESRKRVEEALKAQIETELASPGALREAKEFSRGIFFSRSRPATLLAQEQDVINQAARMDEAAFGKFARNLATLKQRSGGSQSS
jgi:hypothetical protein